MRYGLGGIEEKTLEETRKVYGITKERVRQIEKAALDKLREKAKNTLKNYNN
jgi:RNA polymerase primary sigma factor